LTGLPLDTLLVIAMLYSRSIQPVVHECLETNGTSGVTMGWLLRLVTGAPTVLFYFKSERRGPDLRK